MAEGKEDFYNILGISRNASLDEIRKAYRNLALKYHPDKNPGNKEAEEKMKKINEAYEILSDSEKRKVYDQFGHEGISQGGFPGQGAGGYNFNNFQDLFGGRFTDEESTENIFEDLLGDFFGGGRSRRTRASARKGADLQTRINITLEEAYSGIEREIELRKNTACTTCSGTGAKTGSSKKTCPSCKGKGEVRQSSGFFSMVRTCSRCQGEGTVIEMPCPECSGKGFVKKEKKLKVTIPAGIDTGQTLRAKGEGEPAPPGGLPGDLFIVVNVLPHRLYKRSEDDLLLKRQINFPTAALGGSIDVKTIDGHTISVKIPSGTQNGTILRLKEKGMPIINRPGRYGDLMIELEIAIPKHLSGRQTELLKEFQKIEDEKDSSGFFGKIFK